ncbi:MAG: hypothetical protein ACJ790_03785, partial [Myxococcaceae bacterium]
LIGDSAGHLYTFTPDAGTHLTRIPSPSMQPVHGFACSGDFFYAAGENGSIISGENTLSP